MTEQRGEVIRSADNRFIKYIRSLRQRHVRESERAFVVEGKRAVDDALAAGGIPRLLAISDACDWRLPALAGVSRVVDTRLFRHISETETPQGVLAVFDFPSVPPPAGVPLILVADGINDPGNLGTMIRSAAAAGATGVAITPGTVDPFNGKVVRAAVGAHFRVPIVQVDELSGLEYLKSVAIRLLASADAPRDYDQVDFLPPVAIIVGSEAQGPTPFGRALATEEIRIPLGNDVESLNAATAGAILLFEARRQRRYMNK